MANALVLLVALVAGALLAFHPRLRDSRPWRATVTPLASIMGSGFLVSAPLLVSLVGTAAPLAMASLLVVAYGVGAVIRFNIRYAEPLVEERAERSEHSNYHGHHDRASATWEQVDERLAVRVEQISHLVLASAYVVSVSYYLQLFAAFVLRSLHLPGELWPRVLTTAVLVTIAGVGAWRGLAALEGLERYAVSLNLGTITALLVALAVHDGLKVAMGDGFLPTVHVGGDPVHTARGLMGLLIVVQGFETSRFLGSEHPAGERIRTMRLAQLLSAGIYLVFTTLALGLFTSGQPQAADVTAIIALVAPVATVLPILVTVAAAGSQVSAAIADDAGCSGLAQAVLAGRLPARYAYLLIGLATIALTWLTDPLQIISIASRAFALFYSLQCVVAVATAAERRDAKGRGRMIALGVTMAVVCIAVTVFGLPAE